MQVFIDGREGTTGLRIHERLSAFPDISLLTLPEERRKDPAARRELLHEADIAFFCLPDDAARESVALIDQLSGSKPKIIDASTAHRVAPGWVFGFPELVEGHWQAVARAETLALALGRALADDIAAKRSYFDQRVAIDANRRAFQDKIRQNREQWPSQYAYWEKRNWA